MASCQAETIAPKAARASRGQKSFIDCSNELESDVVVFECVTDSDEWKITLRHDPAGEMSPFCSISNWVADDLWDAHFEDIIFSKD